MAPIRLVDLSITPLLDCPPIHCDNGTPPHTLLTASLLGAREELVRS